MIFIDLADESIRHGIASFVCNCLSASWNCLSASLLTQISSDRGLFGTAFMRRASTRATRSAASVLSPLLHWLRSELKRIQGGSYHVRVACRMNTKNAWIHLPPFYIYVLRCLNPQENDAETDTCLPVASISLFNSGA